MTIEIYTHDLSGEVTTHQIQQIGNKYNDILIVEQLPSFIDIGGLEFKYDQENKLYKNDYTDDLYKTEFVLFVKERYDNCYVIDIIPVISNYINYSLGITYGNDKNISVVENSFCKLQNIRTISKVSLLLEVNNNTYVIRDHIDITKPLDIITFNHGKYITTVITIKVFDGYVETAAYPEVSSIFDRTVPYLLKNQ